MFSALDFLATLAVTYDFRVDVGSFKKIEKFLLLNRFLDTYQAITLTNQDRWLSGLNIFSIRTRTDILKNLEKDLVG